MNEQRASRLNSLLNELPEGLLVDAAWLERRGIARNLRAYYVRSGWLVSPARGVYRRPRGTLGWEQVVISMQMLLGRELVVGAGASLTLQGLAHYLREQPRTVHLYGPQPPPHWLGNLGLDQRLVWRNSRRLFADRASMSDSTLALPWGQWDWPLVVSRPERAFLEMLDELPDRESFRQVDMVMQGASNFSPRRLNALLTECRSIKVKRLFFFFADRHRHAWRRRLDAAAFDLGRGKRMLARGGRLDPVYQITIPEDLDGLS